MDIPIHSEGLSSHEVLRLTSVIAVGMTMMMASVSSYFLERRYDQRPMFAVVLMLIAWCTLTLGSAMSGLGRLFRFYWSRHPVQWIHRTGAFILHPTTDPSRTTRQFKVAVARFVRNHLQHPFADHSKRAHLRHRSHCPQSALLAPFTQPVYGCSKCTTVDICIDQHVSHHQSLLDPKSTRPSTKSVLATGDVLDLRGHRDSDQCSTEFPSPVDSSRTCFGHSAHRRGRRPQCTGVGKRTSVEPTWRCRCSRYALGQYGMNGSWTRPRPEQHVGRGHRPRGIAKLNLLPSHPSAVT